MTDQERMERIEKHQLLIEAHQTVLQSLKYPETVNAGAVAKARCVIRKYAVSHIVLNDPLVEAGE